MVKSVKVLLTFIFGVLLAAGTSLAADYNGHFGDMDKDGDDLVSWEEFQEYFAHAEKTVFDGIAEGKAFDHDAWHEFKEEHGYGHIEGKGNPDEHRNSQHDQELKRDYAKFDKAFIPALSLTNQSNPGPAKKALKILEKEWNDFKGRYAERNQEKSQWKKKFDDIDGKIKDAVESMFEDEYAEMAHHDLEEVRKVLYKLRAKSDMDYYLDRLTEFHESMEKIFHFGEGKKPGDITESELKNLKAHLAEAEKRWEKVMHGEMDAEIFGLSQTDLKNLKQIGHAEKKAMKKLAQAMDANDQKAIVQASLAIKPNYGKYLKTFGDFDRVKK